MMNKPERLGVRFDISKFIERADMSECQWIIGELIDRVSDVTGQATELEDAYTYLTSSIDEGL